MHFLSLIAPDALPVRRSVFPVPSAGNFAVFGGFPRVSGASAVRLDRKLPCGRELPRPQRRRSASTASAPQPSISAAPPNGAIQPSPPPGLCRQREQTAAEQHDTRGKTPPGDCRRPAPRLAALRQRDDRDQRRRVHHAVPGAGAQQLGRPRGRFQMRRERARHHRGETGQPGDRQPYPRHLSRPRSRSAVSYSASVSAAIRSRRTRARQGAVRPGPSRAAAAGRGPAPRSRGTAPRRLPAGRAARSPLPAPPGRTISRHPGMSLATIARPQDAASSSDFGSPSP